MSKSRFKHSEETKEKMRQAHKGKTLSEEHRRKIGEATRRRLQNAEEKEKLRQANIGRKKSEEARRKMSEAAKKRRHSEEHKRKIGEATARRIVTDETREKLRQRALERGQGKAIPGEETRRKMSEARKGKKLTITPKWVEATKRRAELLRGRKQTEESNLKRSLKLKGRITTDEHRQNLSISSRGKHSGENNPHYIDGRTKEKIPYPIEFTYYLKRKVRVRDSYTCQCCFNSARGKKGHIHHIDGDKNFNDMSNLILICISCHNKIHCYGGNEITDKVIKFRNLLKPENRPLKAQ